MKVFERDGIFSLGISVPQYVHFPNGNTKKLKNLEKVIQQKAEEAKPAIQKLFPKLKFKKSDFQLIKDSEFNDKTHSKIWVKMYNDKRTQKPQANLRKPFPNKRRDQKGKKT